MGHREYNKKMSTEPEHIGTRNFSTVSRLRDPTCCCSRRSASTTRRWSSSADTTALTLSALDFSRRAISSS